MVEGYLEQLQRDINAAWQEKNIPHFHRKNFSEAMKGLPKIGILELVFRELKLLKKDRSHVQVKMINPLVYNLTVPLVDLHEGDQGPRGLFGESESLSLRVETNFRRWASERDIEGFADTLTRGSRTDLTLAGELTELLHDESTATGMRGKLTAESSCRVAGETE